jgi:ABC-type sulfate transport system substrate-binding protein
LRDRRIRRSALQSPHMFGFVALFGSGDDASLITLTGFDHATFQDVLHRFEPLYKSFSPYSEDGTLRILPPVQLVEDAPVAWMQRAVWHYH